MRRIRSLLGPLLLASATLGLAACAGGPPAGPITSFRIREDVDTPFGADAGWAGAPGESVPIRADRPFRLRFESDGPRTRGLRLQYRRNDEAWATVEEADFPYPEEKTPRVSTFTSAAGDGRRELEWTLVVRRFGDGPEMNEEGDVFSFRVADRRGNPLEASVVPELTLAVPPGHLGGTFVETPGRIGPWQASNGDLYFIMEPTETDNVFMMMKSSDQGRSWQEVDGANRPSTGDLEAVDARVTGHTIHMLHQVTEFAVHHAFRTSDHPTAPDTWAIRDEPVATVKAVAQAASLVVRPDGSMVAFLVGETRLHSVTRSAAGAWGPASVMDERAVHPQAVLGADDVIHLAYYAVDGTLWYRRVLPDGTVTGREPISEGAETGRPGFGSVLPLVYIGESDTLVLLYRLASGALWERRIVAGGPMSSAALVTDVPVVRDAVDSQQAGADVVADGEALHVLFIDDATRSLYSTSHDGAGWQPPVLRVGGVNAAWVRGEVRTRPDGVRVYGFVYDAGSLGGSGMNRYGEIELDAGGGAPR